MAGIKADVLAERTSVARTQYIIVSAVCVVAVAMIAGILSSPLTTIPDIYKMIWATSGFGALGAFFSIAPAIRDRSVLTDLQHRDNTVDAVLRVLIGGVSAAVLYCLLKTDLIQLQLAGTTLIGACKPSAACALRGEAAQYFIIVLAFIAGFSERLVGDLLSGAKLIAGSTSNNPLAGANPPPPSAGVPSGPANEKNPRGLSGARASQSVAAAPTAQAGTPTSSGDDADGCLTNDPIPESKHTADVELPEALGGIENADATKPN